MFNFIWRHPVVRTWAAQQRRSHMYCRSRSLLKYKRPVSDPSIHKVDVKSEWWSMDGEMHEIGENIPSRERFPVFDGINTRERKIRRSEFMRKTRLTLRKTDQESWCQRYSEAYIGLREQWEMLYWDEGYSNKLAEEHANYDSADDDDQDFSPYRHGQSNTEQAKDYGRRYNVERQARKKGPAPFAPFK